MEKGNSHNSRLIETNSPEETEALGEKIGSGLSIGSVAALKGPLGAGKTCFVKGLARSLGVSEEITSPTYTIIFEYEAKLVSGKNETEQKIPFYHIDAYRLEGDDDFGAMGGTEYLGGNGITVVEWCERIKNSFPINTIFIEITILDGKRRLIKIEDHSKESKKE